jgi:hypothetical protein
MHLERARLQLEIVKRWIIVLLQLVMRKQKRHIHLLIDRHFFSYTKRDCSIL